MDHDLVDALTGYVEVLCQTRLISIRECVLAQEVTHGRAQFL